MSTLFLVQVSIRFLLPNFVCTCGCVAVEGAWLAGGLSAAFNLVDDVFFLLGSAVSVGNSGRSCAFLCFEADTGVCVASIGVGSGDADVVSSLDFGVVVGMRIHRAVSGGGGAGVVVGGDCCGILFVSWVLGGVILDDAGAEVVGAIVV